MPVGKNTPIITFNRGYSAANERYDFISAVSRIVKTQQSEDICHYISFSYMRHVLVTAANYFYKGTHTKEQFMHNLNTLAEAVQSGEERKLTRKDDAAMNELYGEIKNCLQWLQTNLSNAVRTADMSQILNTLLYDLNSVEKNLRAGDARWNHSIGAMYDPYGWVHINADGEIDCTNLVLSEDDVANIAPAIIEKECFYMVLPVDCKKYDLLSSLCGIDPPKIFSASYDEEEGTKELLYSSANYIFDFDPDPDDYSGLEQPVYYLQW